MKLHIHKKTEIFRSNFLPRLIIIERRLSHQQLITILIIVDPTNRKKPNNKPNYPSNIRNRYINSPSLPDIQHLLCRHENFNDTEFLGWSYGVFDFFTYCIVFYIFDVVTLLDTDVGVEGPYTVLGLDAVGSEVDTEIGTGFVVIVEVEVKRQRLFNRI